MENLVTIPLPPARGSSVNGDQDCWHRSQSMEQRLEMMYIDLEDRRTESIHSESHEIEETEDDLVISIREELKQIHSLDNNATWSKLCIYKVPKYLHEMHDKSYSPQAVSIGPYYNGVEHLQSMESNKGRAVNKMMTRTGLSIEKYISAMRKLEEKARACYEGVISMSSNDFTKMLVFDGCFVLEILFGAFQGFEDLGYAPNDPIFSIGESMYLIRGDMMMLENQLPFFVLCGLVALEKGTQGRTTDLVPFLANRFFDALTPGGRFVEECVAFKGKSEEMVHFLDLIRQNLGLPPDLLQVDNSRRWNMRPRVVDKRPHHMIHCVTTLRDVGINFRRRNVEHFWDIRFVNGYLEIPELFIHEGTKSLFLNLIAFEQCHIGSSKNITSYIIFMNNLINSVEDVIYLQKCGIIEHWLESSSEVADMFKQIGHQGIVFNIRDSYLCDLSVEVNRYYDQCRNNALKIYEHRNKYFRKWNAWMKTLKDKYFDSPWAYISFLAAFILLVLTSLQCYFAAYEHFNPSPPSHS